jgi:glycosyltransferase involved in cell wall biosynthesis
MVYLSRIHPKKDLLGLIRLLENPFNGRVSLDIYGAADPAAYYEQCVKASARVSEGVRINFKGAIPDHQVSEVLRGYHIFVLFTRGENFGHAIFEAFCSGVPVLISDKTPWNDIEALQAGWIVDPQNATQCLKVLDDILDMESEVFQQWKVGARAYAESFMSRNNFRESYKRLFS